MCGAPLIRGIEIWESEFGIRSGISKSNSEFLIAHVTKKAGTRQHQEHVRFDAEQPAQDSDAEVVQARGYAR